MTFQQLKDELERMSQDQLDLEATAFVVRRGEQFATKIQLYYEVGDALLENGNPYFLVG